MRSEGLTPAREQVPPAPVEAVPGVPAAGATAEAAAVVAQASDESCALSAEDLEDEAAEAGEGEGDDGEGETPTVGGEVPTGPVYSAEISDDDLTRRWKEDIASLGSMAVGFAHSGRLVNSVQFPRGDDWIVVSPEIAWGTQESIDYLVTAIREVRSKYPEAPPIRVNGISNKEGGYKRPHKSHQNGRDVDVGFYYPTVDPIRERERERYINVPLNWAFIRAVVTKTDIQLILVDKRVQKVLYEHALAVGEDKAWLDSLFSPVGIIRHARRHRDHFHLRFHNPRAQELGRRVQPLLSLQPEHNVMLHRVRSGDTLGGIALKYGSTVSMIRKANRMKNNFLRAGQRLSVPLRGPCTNCPVPPPFVLPPRQLPPETQAPVVAAATSAAPTVETALATNCAKPTPVVEVVKPTGAAPVAEMVKPAAAPVAETVKAAAAPVAEMVKPAAAPVAEAVKPAVAPVAEAVKPAVAPVAEAVKPAVAPVAEAVKPAVAPVAEMVKPAVAPVAEAVKPAVAPVAEAVKPAVAPVAEAVTPAVAPVAEAVKPVAAPVAEARKPAIDPAVHTTVPVAASAQSASMPVSESAPSAAATVKPASVASPHGASEGSSAGISHGR
ncbi:penicillin-insensitive murein endopeptidase [Myxococcus eversor]|uniref:penicillin-insensitive murein endopeptidase n=1 Tax=Myxococcus eversor TaxID=2709661 RepID=UPI001967D65E|nr:penicillin-insensitive murein endopeptidase [Myxococcus eversor]